MPFSRPASPSPAADRGALSRLVRGAARLAERRPKTIVALWLLLVVGCIMAGSLAGTQQLTESQAGVGESARADARIERSGLRDPAAESILVRSADPARTRAAVAALERRARALPSVAGVHGPRDAPELARDGGRTALVQATLRGDPDDAADHVVPLVAAVAAVQAAHPGTRLQQAGDGTRAKSFDAVIQDDLQKAELYSVPLTLLILVLAFGALVAASVPLLLGLTSVAAALGALGLVSQIAPNSESTASLVVLIGLAVGVDYSLFYIRREREERRAGRDATAALDAAAATVGRAILVSGMTVMVALAGLLVTGLADFVSMGLGTILVVLIAVIGSLTVLPAVLALLGDRVDRGRVPGYRWMRERRARRVAAAAAVTTHGPPPVGLWARLARAVTKRPGVALVVSVVLLGALAVPAVGMRTGNMTSGDAPKDLPVAQAGAAIERAFPGAPGTTELVVEGHRLDASAARAPLAALGARALKATGGRGRVSVDVSRDGRTALIGVPMPERGTQAGSRTVADLRDDVAPTATQVPGATGAALVTGDAAASADFADRLATATPLVIAFVLGLGFLLLLLTFRSALLAAAMMGLNLLSIGAAYGILVLVFQHTWAEGLLDFTSTGTVISWLPLFTFVILFGLSMDYTVLVLERIREARLHGARPRDAAAEGVAATAGTVTSAAIVMIAVFAVFATLSLINFKQLGIGLAAAVAIDATIVRGVALPAVVALIGDRWRVRPPRRAGARRGDNPRTSDREARLAAAAR